MDQSTEREKRKELYALFAQRIETANKQAKMTHRQLSEATNKSDSNLSAYLTGRKDKGGEKSECGIFNLVKIADALHVSTDYLLGLTTIPAQDSDLKMICEYTGLSVDAVKILHDLSNSPIDNDPQTVVANEFIEQGTFRQICMFLGGKKFKLDEADLLLSSPNTESLHIAEEIKQAYSDVITFCEFCEYQAQKALFDFFKYHAKKHADCSELERRAYDAQKMLDEYESKFDNERKKKGVDNGNIS